MYNHQKFIDKQNKIDESYRQKLDELKKIDLKYSYYFDDLVQIDDTKAQEYKANYYKKREKDLVCAKFLYEYKTKLLELKYKKFLAKKAKNRLQVKKINEEIQSFKDASTEQLNQKTFAISTKGITPKTKFEEAKINASKNFEIKKCHLDWNKNSELSKIKIEHRTKSHIHKIFLLHRLEVANLKFETKIALKKVDSPLQREEIIKKYENVLNSLDTKYNQQVQKYYDEREYEKKHNPIVDATNIHNANIKKLQEEYVVAEKQHNERVIQLQQTLKNDNSSIDKHFDNKYVTLEKTYHQEVEEINKEYKAEVQKISSNLAKNQSLKFRANKKLAKEKLKKDLVHIKKTFKFDKTDAKKKYASKISALNKEIKNKVDRKKLILKASVDYKTTIKDLIVQYKNKRKEIIESYNAEIAQVSKNISKANAVNDKKQLAFYKEKIFIRLTNLKQKFDSDIELLRKHCEAQRDSLQKTFHTSLKKIDDSCSLKKIESNIVEENKNFRVVIKKLKQERRNKLNTENSYYQLRLAIKALKQARRKIIIDNKKAIKEYKIKFAKFIDSSLSTYDNEINALNKNYQNQCKHAKKQFNSFISKLNAKRKLALKKHDNTTIDKIALEVTHVDKQLQKKLIYFKNNFNVKKESLYSQTNSTIQVEYDKLVLTISNLKSDAKVNLILNKEKIKKIISEFKNINADVIKQKYSQGLQQIKQEYKTALLEIHAKYRDDMNYSTKNVDAVPHTLKWYKLAKVNPSFDALEIEMKRINNVINERFEKIQTSFTSKKAKFSLLPEWVWTFNISALLISWSWLLIIVILTLLGIFNIVSQFALANPDGSISVFGIVATFIVLLVVIINIIVFVLIVLLRKDRKTLEAKTRNDYIIELQKQNTLFRKELNELVKLAKNNNDFIFNKARNLTDDAIRTTENKLKQIINSKDNAFAKATSHLIDKDNALRHKNRLLADSIKQLKTGIKSVHHDSRKKIYFDAIQHEKKNNEVIKAHEEYLINIKKLHGDFLEAERVHHEKVKQIKAKFASEHASVHKKYDERKQVINKNYEQQIANVHKDYAETVKKLSSNSNKNRVKKLKFDKNFIKNKYKKQLDYLAKTLKSEKANAKKQLTLKIKSINTNKDIKKSIDKKKLKTKATVDCRIAISTLVKQYDAKKQQLNVEYKIEISKVLSDFKKTDSKREIKFYRQKVAITLSSLQQKHAESIASLDKTTTIEQNALIKKFRNDLKKANEECICDKIDADIVELNKGFKKLVKKLILEQREKSRDEKRLNKVRTSLRLLKKARRNLIADLRKQIRTQKRSKK